MLQEAIAAVRAGNRARARDLLTRLLKTDPSNAAYWLWMSAAVETEREQVYCLQSLLKLQPENAAAKRGLVIHGVLSPEEAGLAPAFSLPITARDHAGGSLAVRPSGAGVDPTRAKGSMQSWWGYRRNREFAFFAGAGGLLLVALIVAGGLLYFRSRPTPVAEQPTRSPISSPLPLASATPLPSPTRVVQTKVPASSGPTPLATLFPTPFTPTPVYAATPHPEAEAYALGLKAIGRGDLEKALGYFQQVLGIDDGLPDAHYFAGEVYRGQAAAAGPSTRIGKDLLASAVKEYETALGLDGTFAPAHLGRGLANQALGDTAGVPDDLDRAIELDPNFVDAYLARAELHVGQRAWEAALDDLRQAKSIAPADPRVRIELSLALHAVAEDQAALDEAEAGLALDPTRVRGYLARGQAQLALEKLAPAKADLDFYLAYEPGDPRGYLARGNLHSRLGPADPQSYRSALADYEAALSLDSGMTDALLAHGRTLLALEQFADAEKDFTALLGKAKTPETHIARGHALMGQSKFSKALQDYDAAIALAPEDFEAWLGKGRALLELGRTAQAIESLSTALGVAQTPERQSLAHYWRALAHEAAGQFDAAISDWDQVLAMVAADVEVLRTASERLMALRGTLTPQPSETSTAAKSVTATPRPGRTPTPTRTATPIP